MLKSEADMIGGDARLPIPTVRANVVITLPTQENQELSGGQARCLATDAQWRPLKGETHSPGRCALQSTVYTGQRALSASALPSDIGADMICDVPDRNNRD